MSGFIFNLRLQFKNFCTLTFKYEKGISFRFTKNIQKVNVGVFKYSDGHNSLLKII